MDYQLEDH